MLMERKRSISEQQQAFIDYLVKENKNPTESARLSGYKHPKQSASVSYTHLTLPTKRIV